MHAEEFVSYLKYERNYSDRTVDSYRRDLEAFREFASGVLGLAPGADVPDADISERLIRRWMAAMLDKGNTSRSVCRRISALKCYFRFMLVSGRLTAHAVKHSKQQRISLRILKQFLHRRLQTLAKAAAAIEIILVRGTGRSDIGLHIADGFHAASLLFTVSIYRFS